MKKIILVNVAVLTLLWGLSEAVSWYLLEKRASHRFTDAFLQQVYGDRWPDLKTALLEEGRPVAYLPFAEYMERPVRGRHLVVNADGRRSNTAAEEALTAGPSSIYVFGGSTTFGYGVLNHETIPAHLEQVLRENGHAGWRVHNFGAASYYSTPERVRFLQMLNAGHIPGVAVFIDGLNDFHYAEVPDRSGASDQIEHNFNPTAADHAREIVRAAAKYSYTIDLLGQLARRFLPASPAPASATVAPVEVDEVGPAITRLSNNRRMLAAVGREFGIRMLFVQQPVPTYRYDPARGTVPLDFFKAGIGKHTRSGQAYQRLAATRAAGGLADVLWLADLAIDAPMYVDTVHYSSAFNRRIAEEIYGALDLPQPGR
ncbi:SGNH/GDSL hydrolase family protein [Magnetospirillum sp. UT-4]|uniref:SGNH/GDSL hydrolase family protein n=1 Tax=Magnetospirillum sp. UT-4 TaxID=2681467 RepID=UPI0013818258|nr:SGNH/GDSL hydrolase family protein [Magnetospirillum sp. UT-4]CAA7621668.1 conserved exported hypothetical protein [Magnetospirillum sp. UT-4]